ncbi:MAG: hypothetical protein COB23_05860 [Methylophaga sp.]|nr:MAG: hypothetical protein COB23_05860 [Methylophaga sp.]
MKDIRYLFIILMMTLSTAVSANHLPDDIEPGDVVNDIQLPLTKKSAAELAHIETGGKVMSIEQKQKHGQVYFSAKVLHDNGKVKIYRYDRNSGQSFQ